MKRFFVLFALLFALAIPGAAQSLCTITGTLYDSTGAACNGCRLTVSRARSGSTPLSQGSQPVVANGSGAVSFTAVQGSFVTLTGPFTIGRYNLAGGLEFYVPLQSSATLATLQTAEDALNALISSTTYAPADIPVITKTASASLSNEFALGSLPTGLLKSTTGTGVPTIAVAGTDYLPAINGLTEDASPDSANDFVVTYDASAAAHKKVKLANLPGGGGGTVSSVFGRTGAVVAAQDDYTFAQLASKPTTLSGYGITDAQGLDADLTAIAGLSPTNDDIIQRKAGAWTNRTVAQFKTDLGLAAIATSGSASDLSAGTVPLARLAGITNTEIDNAAAIAYSKLNLTGAILNADLAGSIANAKLANSAITIAGTSTSLGGSITLDTITGLSATGVVKRTGANTLAIATVDLTSEVTGDLPFANFVQAGSAGFVGATGAGDYSHRTPAQVTAALDAFVGDSGSGGTKGLVPAPTTGDSSKYLKGDGTWASVSAAPGGSPTQIQYNNAGAFGGISGATSDGTNVTFGSGNLLATSPAFTTNQTTTNDAIGTTSTDGIILQNTTAAAAGAQQYSPRLRLTGQGWKTNATAASQTVDFAIETQPVQGGANPTGNMAILAQVNGGGYTTRLLVASSSNTLQIGASGDGTLSVSGGGQLTLQAAGASAAITNGTNWGLKNTGCISYSSSSSPSASGDTLICRNAAATVRFGAADAASPVAQTLSVQGGSGTNIAGANWTFAGSRGTGTGAGGSIIFQTAPAGGSGTTQNTLAAAFTVNGDGSVSLKSVTFANLPTQADAKMIYCSDCTIASPCASGGSGALAKGIAGAWVCN